jgi:hypothetical protein
MAEPSTKSNQGIFPKFSGRDKGDKEKSSEETETWGQWSLQARAIFNARGVLDAVTGRYGDDWNEMGDSEKKICLVMYESILKDLRGPALTKALAARNADLRGVWKALEEKFSKKSASARSLLIEDLMHGVKDPKISVQEFADKKRAILEQDLGGRVTTAELLKCSVLKRLPPCFNDKVATMMAAEGMSLSDCEGELTEVEAQFDAQKNEDTAVLRVANASSSSSSAADDSRPVTLGDLKKFKKETAQAAAHAAFTKGGKGKPKGKGKQDWNSGKQNQSSSWGGSSNWSQWGGRDKVQKGYCTFCDIWGHKVSECRSKKAYIDRQKSKKGGKK